MDSGFTWLHCQSGCRSALLVKGACLNLNFALWASAALVIMMDRTLALIGRWRRSTARPPATMSLNLTASMLILRGNVSLNLTLASTST